MRRGALLSGRRTGGVLGAALGALGMEFLVRAVDIGVLRPYYPPALWLQAAAVALLVGVVGSLPPALKAVSLSPIEALRYE